jgi:hypothetical protein
VRPRSFVGADPSSRRSGPCPWRIWAAFDFLISICAELCDLYSQHRTICTAKISFFDDVLHGVENQNTKSRKKTNVRSEFLFVFCSQLHKQSHDFVLPLVCQIERSKTSGQIGAENGMIRILGPQQKWMQKSTWKQYHNPLRNRAKYALQHRIFWDTQATWFHGQHSYRNYLWKYPALEKPISMRWYRICPALWSLSSYGLNYKALPIISPAPEFPEVSCES